MKSRNLVLIILLAIASMANALPDEGGYAISNIIARNMPSSKQNGAAWDPMRGAPDIVVAFYIERDNEIDLFAQTSKEENSGTSAIWSERGNFPVISGESNSEDVKLVIKVWDIDMSNHDFVDSGKISFSELETGEVRIELNYGTVITFELDGPFTETVCGG